MPFLPPNQQRQSTEARLTQKLYCCVGFLLLEIVTQLNGTSCDGMANLHLHPNPTDLKHKI